jgi:hypothetical protein
LNSGRGTVEHLGFQPGWKTPILSPQPPVARTELPVSRPAKPVILMAEIQYVSSSAELPTGTQYILVEYGDANRLVRHGRGITMTIDRSMPVNLLEAHTETVIGEAQSMADQENIDTVYVTVPKRSC